MSLENLTRQLTTSFDSKDYENCQLLLSKIKIQLINNNLLVPINNKNTNDLIITRSILEIGALASINLLKFENFKNYILQLKFFYKLNNLTISKNKNKLISLYLLLLLSNGELDKFHIELEYFQNESKTIDDLEKDLYLKFPINLEKWIIDGDYFKIFQFFENKDDKIACEEFTIFEQILLNSIRSEICKNFEKTYKFLPLKNLKNLLFLNNNNTDNDQVLNIINDHKNWYLKDNIIYFDKEKIENEEKNDEEIDNRLIIKNALYYAKEIETII
ncbi:hypothetical protein PACTADRAFT_50259 [Pachysolen tannophilus NRRL Y-2460]|uniref:PCI domain-containing protein n=1 Tax=Pachysolen tannophilus NRRL Y-2460 TaxID=669874 RepID=A0A1E4TUV6_PACTA|nr:hypothetical protein PACTADRAFT_50259 [Pachysolen tannophilus NRRL Y-2460]